VNSSSRGPATFGLLVVCLAVGLFVVARQPAQMPGRVSLIVDTDAGVDDFIAIAYLLARPDVEIQAITSVNGVAHAEPGARNVLRLLRLAGRRIDVYVGEDRPLEGRDAFPDAWRQQADEMAAIPTPMGRRGPRLDGIDGMLGKLRTTQSPVTVLALGPLTNIAEAIRREPRTMAKVSELIVMGGAIDVPGNAPADAQSPVAEWNMFIDPTAASIVFRAGLPMTLVPLDATNRIPIDRTFVESFSSKERSPLGKIVSRLLESAGPMIDEHAYFAWDPLAAAAATNAEVLRTRALRIEIVRTGDDRGRTLASGEDANANVAYDARRDVFEKQLFAAFTHR
jgi:inosine-uridine nucleoside N-ribohydrolase